LARPRPGAGRLPEGEVRSMFDRIARVYDLMNRVMTAGLDARWRERAADLAAIGPGSAVLDVATGTGDLALALARRVGPTGRVVGLDFSPEMLAVARRKSDAIDWREGNALDLPFPDSEFDAVTVAFGVRNFADLDRGLAELVRVVRPGGRVVILEISRPRKGLGHVVHSLWFERLVPLLGRVAGDRDAYSYLPSSVRRFPPPPELAARLAASGLAQVRWIETARGMIAIHYGVRP